jgi:hypothetical protein
MTAKPTEPPNELYKAGSARALPAEPKKPAGPAVTDAQRAVLREVAEEWLRRDAEEPLRSPPPSDGNAEPAVTPLLDRFIDYGQWGALLRFRAMQPPPAPRQAAARAALIRALGLLCQEVARLDEEARG